MVEQTYADLYHQKHDKYTCTCMHTHMYAYTHTRMYTYTAQAQYLFTSYYLPELSPDSSDMEL